MSAHAHVPVDAAPEFCRVGEDQIINLALVARARFTPEVEAVAAVEARPAVAADPDARPPVKAAPAVEEVVGVPGKPAALDLWFTLGWPRGAGPGPDLRLEGPDAAAAWEHLQAHAHDLPKPRAKAGARDADKDKDKDK